MRSSLAGAGFGTLLIGALLLTAQAASAGDDCIHTHRVSCLPQILFHTQSQAADPAAPAKPPVESHVLLSLDRRPAPLGRVQNELSFSVKKGVEYRRHFAVGSHRLTLKLWGPVVKKKPGLGMELKGLELDHHEVRLDAYGNTRRGGVRVRLAF